MKNISLNKIALIKVAKSLEELNDRVVFVGGAVVGLYATDPAADDVRPTKDVDIIIEIASALELENLRELLNQKGFKQTAEDDVICRFRLDDIKIDVMATKEISWAPSNRWFKAGFDTAQTIKIEDVKIKIMSVSYFLATKFEAFRNRGNSDPLSSPDFEDIIYILDNHLELTDEILNSPNNVKKYLVAEFKTILNDTTLQEAILGNLNHLTQTERFRLILNKLKTILSG